MPAKKGENLTYLREDSVSATELSKLGKCECLIKVEKLQNINKGKKGHSMYNDDCLKFLGANSNNYTKERLILETSLVYKIVSFLYLVCILFLGVLIWYIFR